MRLHALRAAPTARSSDGIGLAALSLSMLTSSLGMSIANVGLPALMEAFSARFADAQWVVLAYLLAVTSLAVGMGRLADLLGRRRIMLAGLALFSLASLFCGLADALWQLLLARAAQGVGAAAMMVLAMALVGDMVAPERTGRALGLLGTLSAVGTAAGPALGGMLISRFGWPALFFVEVPLGLLAFYLALRHLPPDRPATTPRPGFDTAGALLLALVLCAYAWSMTAGESGFGFGNLLALGVAAIAMLAFVRVQMRSASPLVRIDTLRDVIVGRGLAVNALVMAIPMTTLVVGPFYLSRALGLDATEVGLAMSSGPLAAAFSGVPAGRAVDRYGPANMAILGLSSMTFACLLLALAPAALGVAAYVAPLMLLTTGYALFQSANATALMKRASPEARGSLSGLIQLSRNLGMITGAALMGTLFSHASEASSSTEGAMHVTFSVALFLCGGAILLALGMRSARKEV